MQVIFGCIIDKWFLIIFFAIESQHEKWSCIQKYDQIPSFLHIWLYLLKKSLTEDFDRKIISSTVLEFRKIFVRTFPLWSTWGFRAFAFVTSSLGTILVPLAQLNFFTASLCFLIQCGLMSSYFETFSVYIFIRPNISRCKGKWVQVVISIVLFPLQFFYTSDLHKYNTKTKSKLNKRATDPHLICDDQISETKKVKKNNNKKTPNTCTHKYCLQFFSSRN